MTQKTAPSSNWLYSDTVKDHFFKPRNILADGEEEAFAADGVGEVGSPSCGDIMKVWIKVDRATDRITAMRWQTFGCASAIGSMSMLSVMVTEKGGSTIAEALKITPMDILERLQGLPHHKVHCSVLGDKALLAAVNDYFKKSEQEERIAEGGSEVVCKCLGVRMREIELVVRGGAKTFEAVQLKTKAGTGCGSCIPKVKRIIKKLVESEK